MQSLRSAALAALLSLAAGTVNAAVHSTSSTTSLIAQAERTKTDNHTQFLSILKQLNQEQNRLSSVQRWHIRYLDAWQAAFAGKPSIATPILHDIIDHSGNMTLATRASALLINILSRGARYEEAYRLANKLMSSLPRITDTTARVEALREIIQMLSYAGQHDQALQYVRQLKLEHISSENRCPTQSYEVDALYNAQKLSSESPELLKAINICLADKEAVYANSLRLDRSDLLMKEGHPNRAMALLHQMASSVRRNGFQPHIALLHVSLARAYLRLGDDGDARKSAQSALAANKHSGFTWPSQAAYKVLYQAEKKAGHDAAALSDYEMYVSLHDSEINDAKARALAYQMVKQQVLAKKLKVEGLTRKNRILRLRQALARKSAETNRLYVALLLILLVLIVLWLYRLKHSQLRFRRMARHDDLTETFNRQHFIEEAKRVLRRLSKAKADACLIIMDLDHFKRINDSYGHIAGDDVLKHAVEVSRRELRGSDVFGRLGGEEFGILMPACSRDQGVEIGERIRHALATTPLKLNLDDPVTVSASFGLACTNISGYVLVQLLIDADAALYVAKRSGRNRLIVGTGKEARFIPPDRDVSSTVQPLSDQ